jgi:uncharacterized protein (DUF2147 family)
MTQSRILTVAAILGGFLLGPAAAHSPVGTPLGTWSTGDGNGVVKIALCGDAFCGRIVGIARPPGAPIPTDVHGESQCGLTILKWQKPAADGAWIGKITDPRSGTTYHAQLWLDARGNLNVHGFIGLPILGATTVWHRFDGHVTPACEMA